MALSKRDYDAQAAEEAFTKVRASFQGGHPFSKSDATVELHGMQVYAQIAQAHALEEIAAELKAIADHLLSRPATPATSKNPGKAH